MVKTRKQKQFRKTRQVRKTKQFRKTKKSGKNYSKKRRTIKKGGLRHSSLIEEKSLEHEYFHTNKNNNLNTIIDLIFNPEIDIKTFLEKRFSFNQENPQEVEEVEKSPLNNKDLFIPVILYKKIRQIRQETKKEMETKDRKERRNINDEKLKKIRNITKRYNNYYKLNIEPRKKLLKLLLENTENSYKPIDLSGNTMLHRMILIPHEHKGMRKIILNEILTSILEVKKNNPKIDIYESAFNIKNTDDNTPIDLLLNKIINPENSLRERNILKDILKKIIEIIKKSNNNYEEILGKLLSKWDELATKRDHENFTFALKYPIYSTDIKTILEGKNINTIKNFARGQYNLMKATPKQFTKLLNDVTSI